jgi:hypothetical protein
MFVTIHVRYFTDLLTGYYFPYKITDAFGFDQSPAKPYTTQQKGWALDHVTLDSLGVPYPNYSQPDVILYSHP